MIRLAVIGADEKCMRAIGPRLRGVTLEPGPALDCAAAIFFKPCLDSIAQFHQAGKPMLGCADPDMSLETLRTLVARQVTLVNPDRYLPSRQLIRQQLDTGKLGTPGLIRIHRWSAIDQPGQRLCDLDLVLWYFGQTPNRVYAVADQTHLGFPEGSMALLDHANRVPGPGYHSLSLIGSAGAAYADDHQNMQLALRGGLPQAIHADEGVVHWAALLQEFADSIGADDSQRVGSAWQHVLVVADAIEKSLHTKQAVVPEGVR